MDDKKTSLFSQDGKRMIIQQFSWQSILKKKEMKNTKKKRTLLQLKTVKGTFEHLFKGIPCISSSSRLEWQKPRKSSGKSRDTRNLLLLSRVTNSLYIQNTHRKWKEGQERKVWVRRFLFGMRYDLTLKTRKYNTSSRDFLSYIHKITSNCLFDHLYNQQQFTQSTLRWKEEKQKQWMNVWSSRIWCQLFFCMLYIKRYASFWSNRSVLLLSVVTGLVFLVFWWDVNPVRRA